jgi:hypothetical protein
MGHGHFVALFDILGFKQRLADIGLSEMLARYESLIDVVDRRKEQIERVFGDFGFDEAPYWTAEGDVFAFTEVRGAYASDSVLLWANRTWPGARGIDDDECRRRATNPSDGWIYHPTPCDNFLDVCNDLMCRGLEAGLPLRGAISVGNAVLDQERNIFLGQPIVDAASLEGEHQLIGASFCRSATTQTIPARFALQFDRHIKDGHKGLWGGLMLDWPRHWRRTRSADLAQTVRSLNKDQAHSHYYDNTLDLVAFSQQFAGRFESIDEASIRTLYEPFSWSNTALSIHARAVRRAPVDPDV